MATVTLTEVKTHLRITNSTEDTVIAIYMDAADEFIANYLNLCPFPQVAAIKAAALLLIGDMYENREATTEKQLYTNKAVESLLYPYRVDIGF